MNNTQEETLVFGDGSSLEENIIIVKKELLRLSEEKLAQYPNSDILQECVKWRKKEIKEVEDEQTAKPNEEHHILY